MSKEQTANQEQLLFTLAENALCLPIADVQEILSSQKLRSVPFAPPWLVGLVNVRSNAWPVINLYRLLSGNAQDSPDSSNDDSKSPQTAYIALSQQQLVLAVDSVQGIKTLHESTEATLLSNALNAVCTSVFKNDEDQAFNQLSVAALFAHAALAHSAPDHPNNNAAIKGL